MDLNRIALFLAGKFPPYYGVPFDKLELVELIRAKSPQSFSDDFFKIFDSQDFYSNCLKRVERVDKGTLVEIVKSLNVPEDAGGLSKKDLIREKLEELKKEYEAFEKMKKNENKKRGKQFEKWFIKLLDLFGLEPKHDIKDGIDQIDGSFMLDGQYYIFEIEWTEQNSNKNYIVEVSDKATKLEGTLGVAISYKGFTWPSFDKVEKSARKNVLMLKGKDLKKVLDEEITLANLIRSIKRRGAEEGKPYLD